MRCLPRGLLDRLSAVDGCSGARLRRGVVVFGIERLLSRVTVRKLNRWHPLQLVGSLLPSTTL